MGSHIMTPPPIRMHDARGLAADAVSFRAGSPEGIPRMDETEHHELHGRAIADGVSRQPTGEVRGPVCGSSCPRQFLAIGLRSELLDHDASG